MDRVYRTFTMSTFILMSEASQGNCMSFSSTSSGCYVVGTSYRS